MAAEINAIAIIYIFISTLIIILKNGVTPSHSANLNKVFIIHTIFFICIVISISWLCYKIILPPFIQMTVPIICHYLILLFIPKLSKYHSKLLIITSSVIIILSYQYYFLGVNSDDYICLGEKMLNELNNRIRSYETILQRCIGNTTPFSPVRAFSNKIHYYYEPCWVLDSEIIKDIELLFKSNNETIKSIVKYHDFNKILKLCSFETISNIPAWHSFFTGIYYKKKNRIEFWHNGGILSITSLQLKERP